jgi:hypothetical protein
MSIIAAGTTTTTALSSTGNTDGTLQFQVNGTTASVTLNTLGAIGVGSTPAFGTAGQVLTSAGSTAAPTWSSVTSSQWTTTGSDIYYNTGNVGIGTSSPSTPLHILSSAQEQLRLGRSSTASSAYLTFYANNSSSAQVQYAGILGDVIASTAGSQSGALIFFTTNTGTSAERVRIDSSGQLGIGTTSANATLHAQGATTTDGSIKFNQQLNSTGAYNSSPQSGSQVALKYDSSGNYAGMGGWTIGKENATDGNYSSYFAIHTRFNGAAIVEKARVSSDGGFSVGTTANPGAGAIYATGNITAYYSSDIKFKENVRDIPDALATVNAIGGKLFDWTDDYIESKGGADGYFVQKADFGVVAQDVQKVFPIAVRTREDGSLAVDYEKLGALAFAALTELTKRVEALEEK